MVSTEIDLGLSITKLVQQALVKTAQWSAIDRHGFAWWPHYLRQRIWATEGNFKSKKVRYRIFVVSDAAKSCALSANEVERQLLPFASNTTGSAILLDPHDNCVRFWSVITVTPDMAAVLPQFISSVSLIQAMDTCVRAPLVAAAAAGELDASAHPSSGYRNIPDDRLSSFQTITRSGSFSKSPWHENSELTAIRNRVNKGNCYASVVENGLNAHFMFGKSSTTLRVVTDVPHPQLGPGVEVVLELPNVVAAGDIATTVAALNRLELLERGNGCLFGSWCNVGIDSESRIAYKSFLPAYLYQPKLLTHVVAHACDQARSTNFWLARDGWQVNLARIATPRVGKVATGPPDGRVPRQHAQKDSLQQRPDYKAPKSRTERVRQKQKSDLIAGSTSTESRLRAAPELEHDVGRSTVEKIYDLLKIDARWSLNSDRGFSWWPHKLSQRVWATPGFEDKGSTFFRIFAVTDVVRNCRAHQAVIETRLGPIGILATGSAAIFEPTERNIKLWSSATVHAGTASWMPHFMSVFTILQAIEAHGFAAKLAELASGEVDASDHPNSGRRDEPDELMSMLDNVIRPKGSRPSAWLGSSEFVKFRDDLNHGNCFSTGDSGGLTAEFPFGGESSLMRIMAEEVHPQVGSGVGVFLNLPNSGTASEAGSLAAVLNRSEISGRGTSHFIGSWCSKKVGTTWFPSFATFLPSLLYQPDLVTNIAMSTATRAILTGELLNPGRTRAKVIDLLAKRFSTFAALDVRNRSDRISTTVTKKKKKKIAPPDSDIPVTETCPVCGGSITHACDHYLATFDLTFRGEGRFGLGLVGGSLANVTKIGELFDSVRDDYAKARKAGKGHASAIPGWTKHFPELEQYLMALGEVAIDPNDYDDTDDYASDLVSAMEGREKLIRNCILAWVKAVGTKVKTTKIADDGMGRGSSSKLEVWSCTSASDTAARLSALLQKTLSKP